MRSRLYDLFILLLICLALLGAGSVTYKVYKDNQYLNEEIGKTQDGKSLTRKTLLDYLILKEVQALKAQKEANER